MLVSAEVLEEKNVGRFRENHAASVDDSSVHVYGGQVLVNDTGGQAIHSTNFSTMESLVVVNVGSVSFKVRFNTDSFPAGSTNDVTLDPKKWVVIPNPEHVSGKVVTLFAINTGDEGLAQFWVSGS